MVATSRPFTRATSKHGVRIVGCRSAPKSAPSGEPARRSVLTTTLVSALSTIADPAPASAFDIPFFSKRDDPIPPNTVRDRTLAYEFTYPTLTASGRGLPVVTARKPEKYSSAAPLTADARQRIVTELVSLQDGLTYTVYVGPATGVLRATPQEAWTPEQVAKTVLTDRSPSRNTQGQRVPLATLESAVAVERDGTTYYVYETVQSGSPNAFDRSKNTYRQSLCVTAAREGLEGSPFLFTLALACPSVAWEEMIDGFRSTADTFTLLPRTDSYVPPDKDPWLFF